METVAKQKEHGYWGAGLGPIYNGGWGEMAAGSYTLASGWEFELSVNHIAHDPASGSVPCPDGLSRHDSHGGGEGSCGGSWVAPTASPWGGGFLVKYNWK